MAAQHAALGRLLSRPDSKSDSSGRCSRPIARSNARFYSACRRARPDRNRGRQGPNRKRQAARQAMRRRAVSLFSPTLNLASTAATARQQGQKHLILTGSATGTRLCVRYARALTYGHGGWHGSSGETHLRGRGGGRVWASRGAAPAGRPIPRAWRVALRSMHAVRCLAGASPPIVVSRAHAPAGGLMRMTRPDGAICAVSTQRVTRIRNAAVSVTPGATVRRPRPLWIASGRPSHGSTQ